MTTAALRLVPLALAGVRLAGPAAAAVQDAPDVFISSRTRHDDIFRLRFTYGAPLEVFFGPGVLPAQLNDLTLSASIEYYRATSNIANFDYRNFKTQALLTKTWRF